MSSDDIREGELDIREKILSQMQSIGQAPTKPATAEEVQTLKSAASRLDQMLKASADADARALKNAVLRLDQFLQDISKGKDFTNDLRRRRPVQDKER